MNKKRIVLFLFILFNFGSHAVAQTFFTSFEQIDTTGFWSGINIVTDSSAFEGANYSAANPYNIYSNGLDALIPDELQGKNIQLYFSAAIRTEQQAVKAIYVITITRHDSLLYWYGVKLDNQAAESENWFKISTDFLLPANYTEGSKIKAYLWNPAGETLAIDALKFQLEPYIIPTYVPHVEAIIPSESAEIFFRNAFYTLLFYPKSQTILLADKEGIPLTKAFQWHSDISFRKKQYAITTSKWKLKDTQSDGLIHRFIFETRNKFVKTKLIVEADQASNTLIFKTDNQFRKRIKSHRQSLLTYYTDDLFEVYRKNTLLDSSEFQQEYYLGREGASIGKADRSLLFYHLTGLSSAQLETKEQLLVFNADYQADHPLIHYPLKADTSNYFIDISAKKFKKGEHIFADFNMHIGQQINAIPRLMQVPGGYEAAVVWTEHADWADIRTQRAVNFGSEKIHSAAEAIGGFVKYGIPVTKSVFYNNPERTTNEVISNGVFPELQATIKTDTAFFSFLRQLHGLGHEICLHTPEQYTSSKENMQLSLVFMKTNFGSPTWIDHGYNNNNNRENLVCDGLQKKSPYGSKELWQQFDVRYLWNASIEELGTFNKFGFNAHMIIPYPGFGDAFPDPVISFNHPENIITWATSGTLEIANDSKWDYLFHPHRLNDLVQHRSIWINHVYPAWVDPEKGYWTYDSSGTIVVQAGLNRSLQSIALLRDAGLLLPTTIQALLSYQEALLNLNYDIDSLGRVIVVNHNTHTINGLSFAILADEVWVNGTQPNSRRSGDDLIFWFDLPANKKAVISFKKH